MIALTLSVLLLVDAVAPGFAAPATPPPVAPPAPVRRLPVAAAPSATFGSLPALLASAGSVSRVVAPVQGRRWIVQIQDVHGNPTAQKNAVAALDAIFGARMADALVMEGQSRDLEPAALAKTADAEGRNAAANELFSEGRLSGGGLFLMTRPDIVPFSAALEDGPTYRGNVRALRDTLAARDGYRRVVAGLGIMLADLRKRHYNAGMYVIDLAIARYEAGDLPLTSLLALLRNRGEALDVVSAALLRTDALASLYDASEVGSELRKLLGQLKGRLSEADAAALFDVAYRFQKGTIGAEDFVSILAGVTSRRGLSLNDFPNLAVHLERTLATRAIEPDKVMAAVDAMRQNLPAKLAVTPEERDVARLSRRLRLLDKLSDLSISAVEWKELSSPLAAPESTEADIRLGFDRLGRLERAMARPRDFYRFAALRNDAFFEKLSALRGRGLDRLVVVAGGFHSGAIEDAARKLGYGYAAFTPIVGDARGWDSLAPLRELARPPDALDAALDPARQTLSPEPVPAGSHARIAATVIARATVAGRPANLQWGRDQLGYLGAELLAVNVRPNGSVNDVDVKIQTREAEQTIRVRLSGAEVKFLILTRPIMAVWTALKKWVMGRYYRSFGIPISDIGLHLAKPVNVRIYPRGAGHGIRYFRKNAPAPQSVGNPIPFVLSYIARNRRRYFGIENERFREQMTEHLSFSMLAMDVRDADIYIDSEEMPILDGSARLYLDALKPVEGWTKRPADVRVNKPYVFWRDENTMELMLPLEENEVDNEYLFVGNYGDMHKAPVEFRHVMKESDYRGTQAALGSYPTFLEKEYQGDQHRAMMEAGYFRGGRPYKLEDIANPNRPRTGEMPSVVFAGNPADWEKPEFREGLARHKVMDVIGDSMLLHQTLKGNVKGHIYAFGSGHRDTAELMLMVESGITYPFQYDRVVGNLNKLLSIGKISREMYDHVMKRIARYKDYDERAAQDTGRHSVFVSLEDIRRLEDKMGWPGANKQYRDLVMPLIREYLFRANGDALALIADQIATPQFRGDQIERIDVRVTNDLEDAVECEVTFVRPGVPELEYPRVTMVVAKPGREDAVHNIFWKMKEAADRMPPLYTGAPMPTYRAGDRTVNYFPVVGPLKSGVFARRLPRGYATFAPKIDSEGAARAEKPIQFALNWKRPTGELEGLIPDESRRKDVAKAVGQMMTAGFLRLRSARPTATLSGNVPMNGQMITNVDLRTDLLFDPMDGRAALAYVRTYRTAPVENYLYNLLNLGYRLESKRDLIDRSEMTIRKEWQPFALDVASVLDGVESALVEAYGPEAGRRGAMEWYRRYLAAIRNPTGPLGRDAEAAGVTFQFRQTGWAAANESDLRTIQQNVGQGIEGVMRLRLEVLEAQLRRQTSFGVIRWMVNGMTWLTGYPEKVWIRLAPYTEQILFTSLVIVLQSVLSQGTSDIVITLTVSMAAWIASHRTVLTSDGDGTSDWIPFGSLARRAQARVIGIGLFVIAAPLAGLFIGPSAAVLISIVPVILHSALNGDVTAPGRPAERLDAPQRAARRLEEAV